LNKSFEHFNNIKKAWNNSKVNVTHIEKGVKEKPAKQDFYHERPNSSNNTANDINKLTQLFTQQLNQEAKRKSPDIVFSNSQS
jgi:ribosome recycling factor